MKIKSIITSIILFLLINSPAFCLSEKEIFEWVAKEMKIEKQYPIPEIYYISREALQIFWMSRNEKTYNRWVNEYGEKKANELWGFCLRNMVALFDPKTTNIYIGNFMERCDLESRVAHEIVHYFQQMTDGVIIHEDDTDGNKYLFREMQATKFERIFKQQFCTED